MTIDSYSGAVDGLDPAHGEVETAEIHVSDDVLVKAFVLGPDGSVEPHEHAGATNVFHVLEGEPTLMSGGAEETLEAPAVVPNARGTVHGARNDTEERAVLTASLSPLP